MELIITWIIQVCGWFVAAYWAIKQVKKSHEYYQKAQDNLLERSLRIELYKEFIKSYTEIFRSINDLLNIGLKLQLNMIMQENNKSITHDYHKNIADLMNSYNILYKNFSYLFNWITIFKNHVPFPKDIEDIIDNYRYDFCLDSKPIDNSNNNISMEDNSLNLWLELTFAVNQILISNKPNSVLFGNKWEPVKLSLTEIEKGLRSKAATFSDYIFTYGSK